MDELKSIRAILEELAAGDDRLRDTFPRWLAQRDAVKTLQRKPPQSEKCSAAEPQEPPAAAER